ncbi:hypothetical protein RRG08_012647 [Elysia crispata]|uniref:Uncharacterized protein n=1 Tax=Elysia crispata TaxID=231223 RepID=A0AAE0YN53_9GAST|nr:hypothetical protein RRG08_012647 [Elysia crispata]
MFLLTSTTPPRLSFTPNTNSSSGFQVFRLYLAHDRAHKAFSSTLSISFSFATFSRIRFSYRDMETPCHSDNSARGKRFSLLMGFDYTVGLRQDMSTEQGIKGRRKEGNPSWQQLMASKGKRKRANQTPQSQLLGESFHPEPGDNVPELYLLIHRDWIRKDIHYRRVKKGQLLLTLQLSGPEVFPATTSAKSGRLRRHFWVPYGGETFCLDLERIWGQFKGEAILSACKLGLPTIEQAVVGVLCDPLLLVATSGNNESWTSGPLLSSLTCVEFDPGKAEN